jgi:excinuclease ABC subunit C
MDKKQQLLEKGFTSFIKEAPELPGVYIVYNAEGQIIYIGKAKNIKSRLKSHYGALDKKTQILVRTAEKISFILCESEMEALILEGELINLYTPIFNFRITRKIYWYLLLNNSTYPSLSLVVDSPTLIDSRLGQYFGPYVGNKDTAKRLFYLAKYVFKLRSCTDSRFTKNQVCIQYHLNLCEGWCELSSMLLENYRKRKMQFCNFFQNPDKYFLKKPREALELFLLIKKMQNK